MRRDITRWSVGIVMASSVGWGAALGQARARLSPDPVGCYRVDRPLGSSAGSAKGRGVPGLAGKSIGEDGASLPRLTGFRLLAGGRVERPEAAHAERWAGASSWRVAGDSLRVRLTTGFSGWVIDLRIASGDSILRGSARYTTDVAVKDPGWQPALVAIAVRRVACAPVPSQAGVGRIVGFTDPIELFRWTADAINREAWSDIVSQCDPVSLRAFKRSLIEQYEPPGRSSPLTFERFLQLSPEMPRAVAEYNYEQYRKNQDPKAQLERELPGVTSVEMLRELSAEDVYARYLEGRSYRHQLRRLIAESKVPVEWERIQKSGVPQMHLEPVGVVLDGDRIGHVVYRHDPDDGRDARDRPPHIAEWLSRRPPDERELWEVLAARQPAQVTPMLRHADGSWWLLADRGFMGIGGVVIGPGMGDPDDEPDGPPPPDSGS